MPGPGTYGSTMNTIGKNAIQISLGGKPKRNDDTLGPGPAGYHNNDEKIKSGSASVRIGSEERKTQFDKI